MKRFPPFALLFAASAAFAQTPSASVVGRVTDASGAVIPGVAIKVVDVATNIGRQATTNETGEYTVPYLNPGSYTLEASSAGFRTYKRSEFPLAVDQALRIDIPLEVGSAAETVTVSDVPSVLNTENGTRGEVTTQEEIKELPLDGRNFSDLAYLTGGVVPKGDGGNDGTYAVNGARADNAGFLIDGMNNTQRRNTGAVINPPIEGIQEFKMLTSGYSAEYGRYAGGMLTVVTKSGTNRLHGSLYEFLRNDMWDAKGYFDVEKSKRRRNQFGATLTGPVYLPKIYDGRNRTFFLFTWDSLREINGKTQRGIVPRPEYLRGDFSKAADAFGKPIALNDPISNAPFPGNQIPESRLNPVALNLAAYYPAPNLTGGVNNFISQGNATTNIDNFGVKLDHQFSDKDRISVSTFWQPMNTWDPVVNSRSPLPIFGLTNNPLSLLSYVRYLRNLTPTLFLELSVNFSRKTNNQVWPYSSDKDWAPEAGFMGGITNPAARGLPYVTVSGYIPLGPAEDYPKIFSVNNYQYAGTTTWVRGRHFVKVGADFLRMQYFGRYYTRTRGSVNVLGRFTNDPMADFLLGWPDTTRRLLDAYGPYDLVSNYAGFVQDDFKVTPALTLNLGLRYEVMKPPTEKYGAWAAFLPALGKVAVAGTGLLSEAEFNERITSTGLSRYVIKASDAGLPVSISKTDWTNFGPRFGFAWRIFGNTSTVLRGGYGIFYGSSSLYRLDEWNNTYPFSVNETYNRVAADPSALTLSNPFPSARRSVGGITDTFGQDTAEPPSQYLQSWNLTIEREFAGGTVLEAAYAGSKGTHLQRRYDVNQAGRSFETRNVRPYAGFNSINIIGDGSNSIYNSGQITVRRRFSRQLFVRASYTYSKSLHESSNISAGTIQYNFSQAQNSRNLRLERGRSDFDIGHTFAGSFIWTPSFARHWLVRDWQLAGTSIIYSGAPFTPRVANVNYSNGEALRPDRLRKGTVPNPSINQWFDRTVFPVVPTGSYRFGNSGRNILDGPGTFIINAAISRRIRLAEQKSLQFRVESFNLPNRPNFNLPDNFVDVISGGTISVAKNNRNLQMALRLEF